LVSLDGVSLIGPVIKYRGNFPKIVKNVSLILRMKEWPLLLYSSVEKVWHFIFKESRARHKKPHFNEELELSKKAKQSLQENPWHLQEKTSLGKGFRFLIGQKKAPTLRWGFMRHGRITTGGCSTR